jgi:hypothetical protein
MGFIGIVIIGTDLPALHVLFQNAADFNELICEHGNWELRCQVTHVKFIGTTRIRGKRTKTGALRSSPRGSTFLQTVRFGQESVCDTSPLQPSALGKYQFLIQDLFLQRLASHFWSALLSLVSESV